MQACEIQACEMHVHEGFCENLARQNTVAPLSQLQPGFRRCRIWVSVIVVVSLRPLFRTLHGLLGYQRSSALFRPVCLSSTCLSVFNLSVCLQPVCLSLDSQSDCLRFFSPASPSLSCR